MKNEIKNLESWSEELSELLVDNIDFINLVNFSSKEDFPKLKEEAELILLKLQDARQRQYKKETD